MPEYSTRDKEMEYINEQLVDMCDRVKGAKMHQKGVPEGDAEG